MCVRERERERERERWKGVLPKFVIGSKKEEGVIHLTILIGSV